MKKFLMATVLALTPVCIASADLKVAVIDLAKAFDQYYKTQDSNALLKQNEDKIKKQIQDVVSQYQQTSEEAKRLQDAAKDPTLSKEARDDKTKALQQKAQDLAALQEKIQSMDTQGKRELQDQLLRSRKSLLDDITKVISDYAAPQGYDVVLDKSAPSGVGAPVFLYTSPKMVDITTEIINRLNAGKPAGASAPKPAAADTSVAPAIPVK